MQKRRVQEGGEGGLSVCGFPDVLVQWSCRASAVELPCSGGCMCGRAVDVREREVAEDWVAEDAVDLGSCASKVRRGGGNRAPELRMSVWLRV